MVMQVATEFGASVKPFTYITAKVRSRVVTSSEDKVEIKEKIKPPPREYTF